MNTRMPTDAVRGDERGRSATALPGLPDACHGRWAGAATTRGRQGRCLSAALLGLSLWLAAPLAWGFDLPALEKRLQAAGEVRGDFVQQRHLRALPQPLRSDGRFELLPGQSLLWHVLRPFEQKLRIDDKGLQHWRDGRWQADAQARAAGKAQLAFFMDMIGGRFEKLDRHFTMKLSGDAQRWQLRLDPSSALMQQIFSRIDIEGGSHVRQVQLHERQGDRVVIDFHPAPADGQPDGRPRPAAATTRP